MISSDTRKAIAVVSNFKFLRNNFDNLYFQLRTFGKYQGEILIITSKLTPTFFIRSIRKKNNIKILRFKKINFDKKTEFELNNVNTLGGPNRNKTKKFQWHKLHLFDEYFKNWDYIFYLDINMNIHYDVNKILDIIPKNCFMARADAYPDYDRELKSQFDQTHSLFDKLEENYKLEVQNIFRQVMYFDTNIIEKNTKNEIINLVKKYPISISNEQAILNLYLPPDKKIYKELPPEIDDFITYFYWKIENKKIIITKKLTEQNK